MPQAASNEPSASTPMLSGEVLIVDDVPENLQVLGAILGAHGLTVRQAPGGAYALRSVTARRPDLILLDIRMPEMDGIETCRRLRDDPHTAGIPVLFLSASQDAEERIRSFAVGASDVIAKPVIVGELLARVAVHLSVAQLTAALRTANDRMARQAVDESALRHLAEGAALDRQARLDLALAAAGMGTWQIDGPGSAISFGHEAAAILGLEHDSAVMGWQEMMAGFPAEERPAIIAAWSQGFSGSQTIEIDAWWTHHGVRRRIRIRGRQSGAPDASQRVIGLVWDITDAFAQRQRLDQSEKLEALGRLAGGLAHDFNNHLQVILANLSLVQQVCRGDAATSHRLSCIERSSTTAAALVRDLLTFARHGQPAMTAICLSPMVADLESLLRCTIGDGKTLELALEQPGPCVSGSREQLFNALLNLCINARDALRAGGRVRIGVSRETVTGHRCRICAQEIQGIFAAISVSDDGIGIPEAIQDRIFEPFFTTKAPGQGSGLGLATVVGCMVAHHGHLLLDSHPGAGSSFRLLLPEAPSPA